MSEQNLAIVRKSYDAWNARDPKAIATLLSADLVLESDTAPGPVRGPQAFVEMAQMYWNAFPDTRLEIEGLHDAGDYVISRWRAVGTHRGELMGIPATNKKVDVHGCSINQLKDGKLTHEWLYWDTGKMLQQLGVLPAAGKGAGAH